MKTARFLLFSDSSFANACDFRSKVRFVIFLADEHGTANIIHYKSSRSRRVTRSVMASEIHSLTKGFENSVVIQNLLHDIKGRIHPIEAFNGSKTVLEIVAKQGRTAEKRL